MFQREPNCSLAVIKAESLYQLSLFLNVGFKIRFLKEGGGKIPHTQLCSQLMVVEVVGHGRFKNIAYYRTEIVHVLL